MKKKFTKTPICAASVAKTNNRTVGEILVKLYADKVYSAIEKFLDAKIDTMWNLIEQDELTEQVILDRFCISAWIEDLREIANYEGKDLNAEVVLSVYRAASDVDLEMLLASTIQNKFNEILFVTLPDGTRMSDAIYK